VWDRIVGFDSLELLAVLAAAVFCFRAPQVEAAHSRGELEEAFGDVGALKPIPLLQDFLLAPPSR
jgi:hypothetical protein